MELPCSIIRGTNPFKLGFVDGSDIHTGLSTSYDDNFFGAVTWASLERIQIVKGWANGEVKLKPQERAYWYSPEN
jgi:uncharacterized protein DUF3604